jgi:hypothetical protein
MGEGTISLQEDFLSDKDKKLSNMAFLANVFAWIILVVFILWGIMVFIGEVNSIAYQQIVFMEQSPGFAALLNESPGIAIKIILDALGKMLQGGVYALILKGVSLALNMLLEIDLNHKEKAGGVQ